MNCVEFACKELEIDRDVLWSAKKTKEVLAKRWTIICYLYELGFNYSEIGRYVNRDHQVVMNAVKKASWDMWYLGQILAKRYDAYITPKKKVPNYMNSSYEVVPC